MYQLQAVLASSPSSFQDVAEFGGTEIAQELAASGIRLTAGSVPSLISAVAATSDSDSERSVQPREPDGAGVNRAMLLVDVLPKLVRCRLLG